MIKDRLWEAEEAQEGFNETYQGVDEEGCNYQKEDSGELETIYWYSYRRKKSYERRKRIPSDQIIASSREEANSRRSAVKNFWSASAFSDPLAIPRFRSSTQQTYKLDCSKAL